MEKWMIVYVLPLEVWVEIFSFPWISREIFGRIVDKIGNHKFAEHAQFFLHEWGKRTLDNLVFDEEFFYSNSTPYSPIAMPQTEMPENLKSFDRIQINQVVAKNEQLGHGSLFSGHSLVINRYIMGILVSFDIVDQELSNDTKLIGSELIFVHISRHFDARTLDFLGRIRNLLTNVEIELTDISADCLENDLRTILTHLTPLLDKLHALQCDDTTLPLVRQCLGSDFTKLKVLKYFHDGTIDAARVQANLNSIEDWLIQPEQEGDNGPRLCEFRMFDMDDDSCQQLFMAIRQQFLAAKTPRTFALNVYYFWGGQRIAEFHEENRIGEQLHAMKRWQIVYGLPLEVWVDIFAFPWISRREFGRLVERIGNFKFAEHAQFYLHEWGKRKLDGELYFEKDGLIKSVNYAPYELRLDVPQTVLPANIRCFEQISIHSLNAAQVDEEQQAERQQQQPSCSKDA